MSEGNDKMATMSELKEMCEQMAGYFLWVFENYWEPTDVELNPDDVNFALFTNNLSFQLAFAIEYDLVELDGLTELGTENLIETYREMANSGAWNRFLESR